MESDQAISVPVSFHDENGAIACSATKRRNVTSLALRRLLCRLSLFCAISLAFSRYAFAILALLETDGSLARYALQTLVAGKRDPHTSKCIRQCVELRRGYTPACSVQCGQSVSKQRLLQLLSMGMLQVEWDSRIGWFVITHGGLSTWTRFDYVHMLMDATMTDWSSQRGSSLQERLLSTLAAWWLSVLLDAQMRAVLIGAILSVAVHLASWAADISARASRHLLTRACFHKNRNAAITPKCQSEEKLYKKCAVYVS